MCIDQANNLEWGHQVSMMGDVYRQASTVHVWLGLQRNRSDPFLVVRRIWELLLSAGMAGFDSRDLMPEEKALTARERQYQHKFPVRRRVVVPRGAVARVVNDPVIIQQLNKLTSESAESWVELLSLMQRSYWERIWIV